jgi:hypothetical protein
MNKERTVNILKQGLLAFVLVTIGFAVGKEVTLRRVRQTEPDKILTPAEKDQVVVSYVHATIRCVSCNTIERLVQETLDEQFHDAVGEKWLSFGEVNFQENTTFAKRYEIVANCVVLHKIIQGKEVKHLRLDKVWELYEDPPAFKKYLGDAIRAYLVPWPGGDV